MPAPDGVRRSLILVDPGNAGFSITAMVISAKTFFSRVRLKQLAGGILVLRCTLQRRAFGIGPDTVNR